MGRTRPLDLGLVSGRKRRNLAVHQGVDEGRVAAPFSDLHHCGVHDLRPTTYALASQAGLISSNIDLLWIARFRLSNFVLESGRTTPWHYPESSGIHAFSVRAIPCSAVAQPRHKIIRNGVALVGEQSVSGSPAATAAGSIRRPHPCASTSSAMTGSRCAVRRRLRSTRARLPLLRTRSCT